ncbi:MAG: hypothetical protein H0U70_02285 [Tatlockia sp.]|nr:hypothetical protein [Tatlockia sp.]
MKKSCTQTIVPSEFNQTFPQELWDLIYQQSESQSLAYFSETSTFFKKSTYHEMKLRLDQANLLASKLSNLIDNTTRTETKEKLSLYKEGFNWIKQSLRNNTKLEFQIIIKKVLNSSTYDKNHEFIKGYNLATVCLHLNQQKAFDYLIKLGYDSCPVDENGLTPLFKLCRQHAQFRNTRIFNAIKYLINNHKPNLNITSKDNLSLLTVLMIEYSSYLDEIKMQQIKELISLIIAKQDKDYLQNIEIDYLDDLRDGYSNNYYLTLYDHALDEIDKKCGIDSSSALIL